MQYQLRKRRWSRSSRSRFPKRHSAIASSSAGPSVGSPDRPMLRFSSSRIAGGRLIGASALAWTSVLQPLRYTRVSSCYFKGERLIDGPRRSAVTLLTPAYYAHRLTGWADSLNKGRFSPYAGYDVYVESFKDGATAGTRQAPSPSTSESVRSESRSTAESSGASQSATASDVGELFLSLLERRAERIAASSIAVHIDTLHAAGCHRQILMLCIALIESLPQFTDEWNLRFGSHEERQGSAREPSPMAP